MTENVILQRKYMCIFCIVGIHINVPHLVYLINVPLDLGSQEPNFLRVWWKDYLYSAVEESGGGQHFDNNNKNNHFDIQEWYSTKHPVLQSSHPNY